MPVRTRKLFIAKNLRTNSFDARAGRPQTIIQLYSPSIDTDPDGNQYKYSALIEDFRIKIGIRNPAITIPDLPTDIDSLGTAEAHEAFKEYQWGAPRYIAGIMIFAEGEWFEISKIPLIRRDPFFTFDLMRLLGGQVSLSIGNENSLGIRLYDAGYGYPLDPEYTTDGLHVGGDELIASVSVSEELDRIEDVNINVAVSGGGSGGSSPSPSPSPTPSNPWANANPDAGNVLVDGNSALVDGNSVLVELN